LVALLWRLSARGGSTAPELAEALEVSVRTIYRDVAALQAVGVPLWTEAGQGGGIRLLDGWRLPVEGFTADEVGVLPLAGIPQVAAELGLGAVMVTAQVKLDAALPPELRHRATRARERFPLDAPGWFQRAEELPRLAVVAQAVWAGQRLDLVYRSGGGDRRRRVDPLGLVIKAGIWYLVATHRGAARSYRVGRIVTATVREERFERPTGFDLAAWWAESAAQFDQSLWRLEVRVRLGPRAWRLAPRALVGSSVEAACAESGPADADGWREVVVHLESEEVALEQLTALGREVEVVSPPSLRRSLGEVGRALAQRNGAVA